MNTASVSSTVQADARPASAAAPSDVPDSHRPYSRGALRRVEALVDGHLTVSALTLVAAALLHGHTSAVTPAVWIRGTIVALGAVVLYVCAARAARGSRSAYRRLRILSAVTLAAIVAVVALPGTFPLWLKAEQAGCGVLLTAVVVLANGRSVRELFCAGAGGAARS